MNGIEQLCPNCGLCCDSTLFADVELQRGDDAKHLRQHGLVIEKKTKTKLAFAQPCSCFDGKLCKIYADRPERCRTFECGLLKKVTASEMTTEAALKKISRAKMLVKNVRELLQSLGQNDNHLSLTKRYSLAMSAPIDLSASETDSQLRGELMLAVNELMQVLQKDFLA